MEFESKISETIIFIIKNNNNEISFYKSKSNHIVFWLNIDAYFFLFNKLTRKIGVRHQTY